MIHINRPGPGHYIGYARARGFQKWRRVTGRCKTVAAAVSRTMRGARQNEAKIRVLRCVNDWRNDWYGPTLAFEGERLGSAWGD